MAQYPAYRETDVVLRDGSTAHIRPATPDDLNPLEDYFIGLTDESRRLRFFGSSVDIAKQARNAVEIDYVDHLTLLAFIGGDGGQVIGGAQYIREGRSVAEIAMSVREDMQGKGLASILIAHLADAAREAGIDLFRADVVPENHRMINVFRRTGFRVSIRAKPGVVEVEFPTELTQEGAEHYEERERIADANAVRTFLEARSIAVIGASRDPNTIGGRVLRNLLMRPFAGVVYPVNTASPAVQGVTAYPAISDIPGAVDLAIVAVPAPGVIEVARACAAKGVRALIVIIAVPSRVALAPCAICSTRLCSL